MDFPKDLLYSKEHDWLKIENNKATVGITDYAQSELGDIVFVELPEIGAEFECMKRFGVVESVKTVSDLFSPVSGKIIEINTTLNGEPEIVNSSPYENGWIVQIEMKNKEELKDLLSAADYKKFVEEEKNE
jgi:glycine cleavage system H protein